MTVPSKRAKINEYARRWRAAHRDEFLAKRRAYMAGYRKREAARIARDNKKYNASISTGARGLSRDELGVTLDVQLRQHELFQAASAGVSPHLPRADRMDIISMRILAMLEGQALPAKVAAQVHYREYHHYALDAIMPGMDKMRLMDTIASDHEHF